MARHFIFLTILFLNIFSGNAQNSGQEFYNSRFSEKTWNMDSAFFQGRLTIDSTTNPAQPALLFKQDSTTFPSFYLPLKINMFKRFYLPEAQKKHAKIAIYNSCSGLKYAWLKVYSFNQEEQRVRIDSLDLKKNENDKYLNIPVENIPFLGCEIMAEGEKYSKKSSLRLDSIYLEIDGKKYTFPDPSPATPTPAIKDRQIIPLTTSFVGLLPLLKDKQIISLGETIHGNERFTTEVFGIIRDMIHKANCRIFFIEFPPERILKWDLFIKDQTSLTLQELLEDLKGSIISPKVTAEILLWLKDYNKKNKEQVSIVGIDVSIERSRNSFFLHDYLYYLNEQKQTLTLDSLATLVYEYKTKAAIEYLNCHPEIAHITGKINFQVIHLILQRLNHFSGVPDSILALGHYRMRDYFMAHMVEDIAGTCLPKDKKAVIYAHWGHANNIALSKFPVPSLGTYLKQKYGKQYYSIALLAGQGTVSGAVPETKQLGAILSLGTPPDYSIEKLCSQTPHEHFFFEGKILGNNLMLIRDIGNTGQVYEWHNLKTRTDGYIFIRDNHGFEIPPGWTDNKHLSEKIKRNVSHQQKIRTRLKQNNTGHP